jgi:hypothetical protein
MYFGRSNGCSYNSRLLWPGVGKRPTPVFNFCSNLLPNLEKTKKLLTRPISSSIVPKGCVIEYYDKVVLYHNAKAKIIENSPSINVRSYLSSIRYRNLITITKEEEISIHSIYPFDEEPIKLTFDDFDFDNIFDE